METHRKHVVEVVFCMVNMTGCTSHYRDTGFEPWRIFGVTKVVIRSRYLQQVLSIASCIASFLCKTWECRFNLRPCAAVHCEKNLFPHFSCIATCFDTVLGFTSQAPRV